MFFISALFEGCDSPENGASCKKRYSTPWQHYERASVQLAVTVFVGEDWINSFVTGMCVTDVAVSDACVVYKVETPSYMDRW